MAAPPWVETVREKRDTRTKLTAKYLEKGDSDNILIKQKEISQITEIGKLTSLYSNSVYCVLEVIKTFVHRAAEAHEKTNCLTEILFDEAIAQAELLDKYFASHGKLIGPLHGIPMTLKDQFNLEGFDSTIGYVARARTPAVEDAVLVQTLKSLGAVILAKTNLPQSIMWCETDNPVWGLTTNPLNPAFTPGGSTGGEGALIALRGSMVGWGTDIGGSIRIPSHINGIWGLKPTSSRLPYQGIPVSTEGQEHVPSAVGPLTSSLSSMVTIMECILSSQPWVQDPKVVPIPWRADIFKLYQSRSLTIGILLDDGVVKVHPPIERVLKDFSKKLVDAGHELIHWENSGHKECIDIMDLFYSADGGEDIRREVQAGGEPFIPHVEALINRGKSISVYEYWQLNKRKLASQKAYNDKWNSIRSPISGRNVDVLLMPTMPHPAVPHRACRWVGYTKIWNFLDYTALCFPAGRVDTSIDGKQTPSYQPRNEYDAWNWKLYGEEMDGHPVGLQLVGRRFEEEKVLGIATALEPLLMI